MDRLKGQLLEGFKKAHITMGKLEKSVFHKSGRLEPGHGMGGRFGEQELLRISAKPLFFVCILLKIQGLGSGNLCDLFSSYSHSSRQECQAHHAMGGGLVLKGSLQLFYSALSVCWNQLALAHDR